MNPSVLALTRVLHQLAESEMLRGDGALSAFRGAERTETAKRFCKNEETTMPNVREPLLNPVSITELRPTQITVGMREVKGPVADCVGNC